MWEHSNLMSSGTKTTEALGDNAHLIVRLPDSSWWHHDHVITLRMRHCQSASEYHTNCCWNICLHSAHVQRGAWATNHYKLTGGLQFPIVQICGNITVSKKCHCTQNKLLWYLEVRRLSDLLWLYFSPLQHSDVSLTCHKASQLVFRVTGNRIIQTSWVSLAQVHHHQNCWTKKKSTKETIKPCTNEVKVT